MSVLHILVLATIQGLTEFIPVSSSGHLILVPIIFGWFDQGLAFDVMVHLGTSLAAIAYFRKDIWSILQQFWNRSSYKMLMALIISMIPAGLAGVLLKDSIEQNLRSSFVVIVSLIFWGIILIFADLYTRKQTLKGRMQTISWSQAFLIGLAQSLSLIPGTSRSGITISTGLFLGLKKEDAVKFSFLMSIPIILGAGLINLIEVLKTPDTSSSLWGFVIALTVSFLTGLLAIDLTLKWVKGRGLLYFGIYRVILGVLLLILL